MRTGLVNSSKWGMTNPRGGVRCRQEAGLSGRQQARPLPSRRLRGPAFLDGHFGCLRTTEEAGRRLPSGGTRPARGFQPLRPCLHSGHRPSQPRARGIGGTPLLGAAAGENAVSRQPPTSEPGVPPRGRLAVPSQGSVRALVRAECRGGSRGPDPERLALSRPHTRTKGV